VRRYSFGIWRCPWEYSNSERTQQDGADKPKHGAHRQYIELQGKVHVRSPCLFEVAQV
jgi:hypothetical protein